ncbi:Protein of unknown function [Pyronema omphalodes CBS 100304]|nr:Protein of unknown function [Pyronema omphalodes CBS 100304]
MYPKMG